MQTIINNNDSGLLVRTELNNMFTELYASIVVPIRVTGVNANYIQLIPANTFIGKISISATSGGPTLRIGTAPNGQDVLPDTLIGNSEIVLPQIYMEGAGNLYFTISGGTISYRIDVNYNYY